MQLQKLQSTFLYIWHSPTFTTWGSFAVSSLRLIVLMPFILHQLSTEENSVWMLFMSLLAIGNLVDLGFSPTFTRMTAYILGGVQNFDNFGQKSTAIIPKIQKESIKKGTIKEDITEKEVPKKEITDAMPQATVSVKPTKSTESAINWSLMQQFYGTIGTVNLILCLTASIILASFGTFSLWKPVSALANQEIYWQAWIVLCVSIAIIFNGKKYEAILNGLGYVALVNRWNIVFGLLSVLASLLVVIFHGNILYLMLASQFFAIITLFRNRYLLLYEVHEKRFSTFKTFDFEPLIFKIAFSSAWRQGVSSFFAVGITQLTVLMYAQIANTVNLSSYQFALLVISQLAEFSKAPFYSKLPEFARLRAANDIDNLTFRAEKSMQLALLFFVVGGLGIGLVAPFGLVLIQSKVNFVAINLWLFMLLVYFMERMIAMHAQQYITTNRIPYHKTIIFNGIINLLLIYLFIKDLDVWIFPIAQGISNTIIHLWWLPKISMQTMSRPPLQFLWNSLALPLFIFILGGGILWYFMENISTKLLPYLYFW